MENRCVVFEKTSMQPMTAKLQTEKSVMFEISQ